MSIFRPASAVLAVHGFHDSGSIRSERTSSVHDSVFVKAQGAAVKPRARQPRLSILFVESGKSVKWSYQQLLVVNSQITKSCLGEIRFPNYLPTCLKQVPNLRRQYSRPKSCIACWTPSLPPNNQSRPLCPASVYNTAIVIDSDQL
jgi:hypothetical protein